MWFLFFFLSYSALASEAQKKNWEYINGDAYLSAEEAKSRYGLRTYFDKYSQRLLVEGEGRTAFFIPESNYALIQGSFRKIEVPILWKSKIIYIPANLIQSYLSTFVQKSHREKLQVALRELKFKKDVREYNSGSNCALGRSIRKIFIDPGHGGEDKGAVRFNIEEKNVTLRFAEMVEQELIKLDFSTKLSRRRDEFILLDIRPELARSWGADVFISIHANTSIFPGARGSETYILSSEASDAEARKLAISENAYLKQKEKSSENEKVLENIIWDIQQMAYLQDSAYLASNVHGYVLQAANEHFSKKGLEKHWKNRGVREAPFVVLSRASMPAVLVELAFLSNNEDRALLTSHEFQLELARGLALGIKKFSEFCEAKK